MGCGSSLAKRPACSCLPSRCGSGPLKVGPHQQHDQELVPPHDPAERPDDGGRPERLSDERVGPVPALPLFEIHSPQPSGGGRLTRNDVAMAETPSGPARLEYRFYCPLCMLYFKSIHRMSCCDQYVCSFCFSDYGARQGLKLPSLDANDVVRLPADVPCPCCSTNGRELEVRRVDPTEQVRSYDDSPRTRAMMPAIHESLLSPVRVGESFDTMQRKMLRFESAGYRGENRSAPGHDEDELPAAAPAAVPLPPLVLSAVAGARAAGSSEQAVPPATGSGSAAPAAGQYSPESKAPPAVAHCVGSEAPPAMAQHVDAEAFASPRRASSRVVPVRSPAAARYEGDQYEAAPE
ncbi:hypothetical protein T492DRAFT_1062802, partial [Pavlovales sp. CCMP2436]|mmetsp:Transcript_49796/g.114052  ORF Transcript_49796/g.114052 Transcript_49796/m.114052 type:complete len:350 (-) Transcript_49796:92-1141(-)